MAEPPRRRRLTDDEIARARHFSPYLLLPWVLLTLVPLSSDVLHGEYPRPSVALVALAAFVVLYCGTVVTALRPRLHHTRLPMLLAALLVPVTSGLAGALPHGFLLFPLLAAAGALVVPGRWSLLVLLGVPALSALTAWMRGQYDVIVYGALGSFLAAALVLALFRLSVVTEQLKEARRTRTGADHAPGHGPASGPPPGADATTGGAEADPRIDPAAGVDAVPGQAPGTGSEAGQTPTAVTGSGSGPGPGPGPDSDPGSAPGPGPGPGLGPGTGSSAGSDAE
ncbi:hypothetical protein [Streptacidiphilus rugosus]|uniref:hypothetical protein n=1 Tax=Streptacidiphilus rugosus TaxID=405783 RepID=UPI00068C6A4D|nr:hypothetical protein [Streptacidiphilus rugosus]